MAQPGLLRRTERVGRQASVPAAVIERESRTSLSTSSNRTGRHVHSSRYRRDGLSDTLDSVTSVSVVGEQQPGADTPPPGPRLAHVLDRAELREARATVRAGRGGLDNPVRLVLASDHPQELRSFGGGELLLSSAFGPACGDPAELARSLVGSGVAGLLVRLDPPGADGPDALVAACERARLPLVTVASALVASTVAEVVHALCAENRVAKLLMTEDAHETFTHMCVEGAPPQDIVDELARLCGCPAVFENLMHQVLAYAAAGTPVTDLLEGWEARSRRIVGDSVPAGWLAAWVEVRGRTWGRLVLLPSAPATATQHIALNRAAAAVALNRLLEQSWSRSAARGAGGLRPQPMDVGAHGARAGLASAEPAW